MSPTKRCAQAEAAGAPVRLGSMRWPCSDYGFSATGSCVQLSHHTYKTGQCSGEHVTAEQHGSWDTLSQIAISQS